MAETVKPETEAQIADYVKGEINYNKTTKAIRALRALNLIVVKPRPDDDDLLELHPIVRHFVRRTFSQSERLSFINSIRQINRQLLIRFRPLLQHRPALSALQRWTEVAELDIEAGSVVDGLKTLVEVANPFAASAYPREFCRVAKLVFANVNWEDDYSRVDGFDFLVQIYAETLAYLGEHVEVSKLLDRYSINVPNRDARYIRYCGMRCHAYWQAGDLVQAVQWGRNGKDLKEESDVDSQYDIAHQLALAERDAGRPELALPVFLNGRQLEEVTDPAEFDEKRGGPHYGNIGRCLQFMGQIEPALICFQKSALAIEKQGTTEHLRNQGFIRMWLGELFVARGDLKLAAVFFTAARAKWELVSPPKASTVSVLERSLDDRLQGYRIEPGKAEALCLDWIRGRAINV